MAQKLGIEAVANANFFNTVKVDRGGDNRIVQCLRLALAGASIFLLGGIVQQIGGSNLNTMIALGVMAVASGYTAYKL